MKLTIQNRIAFSLERKENFEQVKANFELSIQAEANQSKPKFALTCSN